MTDVAPSTAPGRRSGPEGLRAASRAMSILFALAERPEGMTLSDLARECELTLTTVHRMVGALREQGLTRETSDGRQALGPGTLVLARGFLGGLDFRVEALPVLSELREITDEACHLATLAPPYVVYVDKLDSTRAVRVSSRIGATAPAVRTALGRALLAYSPPDTVAAALEAGRTQLGIDDEGIQAQLATTRRRGFAVDDGENEHGVHCIGAPVFDADSAVIAAISVSIPSVRFDPQRQEELGALVRASADRISAALGYQAVRT